MKVYIVGIVSFILGILIALVVTYNLFYVQMTYDAVRYSQRHLDFLMLDNDRKVEAKELLTENEIPLNLCFSYQATNHLFHFGNSQVKNSIYDGLDNYVIDEAYDEFCDELLSPKGI